MKAAYVKCLYCEQQFNRNDPNIEVKKVGRRYAHLQCWEQHMANMTKEEKDEMAFYVYVQQLFGSEYNYTLTKKLAERYHTESNYTYSGMLKTLKWYYEKEGHSLDKSNGSIGIIPYVYQQALNYYYNLYKAQLINQEKDIQQISQPQIREITIQSPTVYQKPPKLWLQ